MRLAALVIVAIASAGASDARQARDSAVAPAFGTATVSGIVVNDDDPPRPVRRAVVTLTGPGLTPSRGAITDDNGRFAVGRLPPGRFTLTVTRASFVTSMYGAKRPGRPGTPLDVADGAALRDLVVRIWRGAAVAGTIRDDTGGPAEGIVVTAVSAREVLGSAILTLSNNGVRTNARGEYRIFGLEPGTYVISATGVSGSGEGLTPLTDAQVDAALEALRRRGAGAKPAPVATTPSQAIDFAPVFFPGTAALEQARPVSLSAGQEILGLDFAMQRVPTSVVEGTVLRQDGSPAAGASLQLRSSIEQPLFASVEPRRMNGTAGSDGRFRLARVTPGQYRLVARATPAAPQAGAPGGGGPAPASAGSMWAATALTVTGSDVSGLVLTVEPGVTVSGRIRFERSSPTSTTPLPNLASLRTTLLTPSLARQRPNTPITQLAFGGGAAVLADGTFSIAGLLPDVYRFSVTPVPPGWVPRRAMLGDRDLFDGPADFSGAREPFVDVVFTDNASELSGRLVTASGAPLSDVFVIAFTADRRAWGAETRRVQAVRPDVNGRFVFAGLPPGDYLLGAVLDIDQGDWLDAAFLERLAGPSAKVSLAEGEKKTIDIKVAGRVSPSLRVDALRGESSCRKWCDCEGEHARRIRKRANEESGGA